MTRGGDAAPTEASGQYSTSVDVGTALANITAEMEAAIANSDSQLEELAEVMNQAHATLRIDTLRPSLEEPVGENVISDRQLEQVRTIERAARALTVRTLELDSTTLSIAQREARLLERQREFDTRRAQIITELREREETLSAREASLKFSSVDLAHLHTWSRALDKRESQLAEMEAHELRRVALRRDQLARWEQSLERARMESEARTREREVSLDSREKAVAKKEEEIALSRTRMLLQIEGDRAKFWKHVRVLSTDVAEELETLQRSYRSLEAEFKSCVDFARCAMSRLSDMEGGSHTGSPALMAGDASCEQFSRPSLPFIGAQSSAMDISQHLLAGLSISDTQIDFDCQDNLAENPGGTANEAAEDTTKESGEENTFSTPRRNF